MSLQRQWRLLVLLTTALAVGAPAAGAASATDGTGAPADTATVVIRLGDVTGRVNPGLVGFDFHFEGPPPRVIAPLHPRFIRLDASLEQLSPAPGVLKLTGLQRHLASVRALGAQPLVILDYTPAWLGQPVAPLGDRTRTEPTDLNLWRALIERVVTALARGPGRVRYFEAWNEPDLPSYWDGTQSGWLDTAAASAQAVHNAALRTRLPLRFGGPGSFFPDAQQISAFVSRLRSEGIPPAFVSWHYYADYPCLGPDGPENPNDPSSVALQHALGCANPSASPTMYSTGTGVVRDAIASAAPGSASPSLILDEWNLSAGGLDSRMSTNVGAAFDVATLTTFQADRLDAAAFYQATDTDPRPGGWGTVSFQGRRRPSWWAFWLWRRLAPLTVASDGSDPGGGFWAIASRDRRRSRVTLLLSAFSASAPTARSVTVSIAGLPRVRAGWQVEIRRLDQAHPDASRPAVERLKARTLHLTVPAQAVALVSLTPESRAPRHRRSRHRRSRRDRAELPVSQA